MDLGFRQWFENSKWQTSCVILIKDDKALILRRGPTAPWMPGKWNLPGGGVDPGETPEEAARREAKEETGLSPRSLRLMLKVEDAHLGDIYFFLGKAAGEVKLDYENDEFRWVTHRELGRYDFVPYVEGALQRALL